MAALHQASLAGCLKVKVSKHLIVAKLLAFIVLLLLPQSASSDDAIKAPFSATAMSYVDTDGVFLYSGDSMFSLSFFTFQDQASFYLCVTHVISHVIVWTANRDSPISQSDKLVFQDGNAALVRGNDSFVVWSTSTTGAEWIQMQNSGNLVLLDAMNKTVWQSFDFPTDTLLTGQALQADTRLVSSRSDTSLRAGAYSLLMKSGDLQLAFTPTPNLSQPYWSMLKDSRLVNQGTGTPTYAVLSSSGLSLEREDSPVVTLFTLNCSASVCRTTLESDGNLQIYVFLTNIWTNPFSVLSSGCQLPLYCGYNGVCNSGQCSCPDSLKPLNKWNITEGCEAPPAPLCTNSSASPSVGFEKIGDGLDYFANQFIQPVKTAGLDACLHLCTNNCSCSSLFFYNGSSSCFMYSQIGSVQSTANFASSFYIKKNSSVDVSGSEVLSDVASSEPPGLPSFVLPVIIGGSIFIIFVMICIFLYWFFRLRKLPEDYADDDIFLDSIPGLPTRFSFKELQIATKNFSKKLGTGGFGCVYEGVLPDKTKVAVKQLESVGQGKKEFRAEVAIIGKIHHHHLVQLRGFCAEGVHRLLVYEFMPNSSLDKCLFVAGENSKVLDWKTRYKIALGTAQGLAYLHDECREKIIHCDIKPENILLDENYNAKVSDFGLAKLLNKEQSQVFTTMRGTRGYLAPEWLMNMAISEKSDVYSFGMVLLEIISGRKNYEPSEPSEKCYFPGYAFQQAERGALTDLVDPKLQGSASTDQIIEVVRIALWCIQEETPTRPSMAKVVQMLEGHITVPEPPLSSQFAVRLHARMVEAMTSTEKSSSTSEPSNSASLLSAVRLSAPR